MQKGWGEAFHQAYVRLDSVEINKGEAVLSGSGLRKVLFGEVAGLHKIFGEAAPLEPLALGFLDRFTADPLSFDEDLCELPDPWHEYSPLYRMADERWKIGRYIAITIPATTSPMTTMMIGSISVAIAERR